VDVISYTYGQIKIKEGEEKNPYILFSNLFLLPASIYLCSGYKVGIWLESRITLHQISTEKKIHLRTPSFFWPQEKENNISSWLPIQAKLCFRYYGFPHLKNKLHLLDKL